MSPSSLGRKLQKARGLLRERKFAEALQIYATLFREFPRAIGEYGSAAAAAGDFALADRLWEQLRRRESKNAGVLLWLAAQYGALGLHGKAHGLFAEAALAEPPNLEAQIRLATFLVRTGGIEGARAAVSKCLSLDARNHAVRYLSALLARHGNNLMEAERQLRELIADDIKQANIRHSCYAALASILDETGRFDEAIACLAEAKKRGPQPLNSAGDWKMLFQQPQAEVDRIKSIPKNILEQWEEAFPPEARKASIPLVFLTGSTRSGTTLLERVLDAHPGIMASDEFMAFQKIHPQIDIDAANVPAPRLNAMRELYAKNVSILSGQTLAGRILLDKNPGRTIWLPAFLRVFPELRVLVALRDPRDVMVSLYFQDHPNTNSLTFEQLAHYYTLLMDSWLAIREWEGITGMETRYEDTVEDLEKEGRRVTGFLGLEWHENQLRFHEHNRGKPILSDNAHSVAKPVYKRAVGRWRAYEKQLAPVLPVLEPYCRKFGYE
jgi:tetratricopeptide (TPR) repeat protein